MSKVLDPLSKMWSISVSSWMTFRWHWTPFTRRIRVHHLCPVQARHSHESLHRRLVTLSAYRRYTNNCIYLSIKMQTWIKCVMLLVYFMWMNSNIDRLWLLWSFLIPHLHDAAGCQTGLYNWFWNPNVQPLFVQPVDKPGLTNPVSLCWTNSHCSFSRLSNRLSNGLATGWMFVYTIQPIVKPVCQSDWQPLVSCIQTFNRLSNRLTTGLTTGCIV